MTLREASTLSRHSLLLLALPILVAACGTAGSGHPAAGTGPIHLAGVAPSRAPIEAQPSCATDAWFDGQGGIHWAGATYLGGDHSDVTDTDRGSTLRLGCDGRSAYTVKSVPSGCQLMVLDADGYNVYAAQPVPAGCPTSAPQPPPTQQAATPPPPPGDCPSLPPQQPGRVVSEDFGDVVIAGGVEFIADNPPRITVTAGDVGPVQFTVRCSYSALNAITRQQTPELRNHDATFLAAGQAVYALKGWPMSCRLAARAGEHWRVYLAHHPTDPPGAAIPCAGAPRSGVR